MPRLDTAYITYRGETGDIRAYAAWPKGEETLPGVIVIHENTGLPAPHRGRGEARRSGGVSCDRTRRAITPGGTPANTSQATSLINQLDAQATTGTSSRRFNTSRPSLKRLERWMHGLLLGRGHDEPGRCQLPDLRAAVPFYGTVPASADVSKIKASLLCHYGALDTRINAGIEAFEAALKAASIDYGIYVHKGADHAFFNDTRPDRYHKEAADLAWRLTLGFFQATLKDDRLVAYYRLDEAAGPTAKDSAGGHDGTLKGEPLWQPGAVGSEVPCSWMESTTTSVPASSWTRAQGRSVRLPGSRAVRPAR